MRKKRWFRREVIAAVSENDLLDYLNSIGILKEVEASACRCSMCGVTVNLENIGAVFPKGDKVHVVCERPLCISRIEDAQVENV